jgi:hypothetical protein
MELSHLLMYLVKWGTLEQRTDTGFRKSQLSTNMKLVYLGVKLGLSH